MIVKLHRLLNEKKLSSRELTRLYLDAIERDNGKLNAYITLCPEQALAAADAADARFARGEALGALDGIPFSLKDNISTRGVRTTCASRMLRNYTPVYNATVWEQLQAMGCVLLGKTNMDEFAMGSSGETSFFGGTKNPFDRSRVAGGSSSGAAAAVAAGLSPFALGSDTGGSIRQPAAFCGVVGLKPTYGAVSRYGLIAHASSLDQIGPLTATVEDAALVFDAISSADPRDATCRGKKAPVFSSLGKGVRGLRVGLPKEYLACAGGEVRTAIENAAGLFRSLGAEVTECSLPTLEEALPVYYILACAEASSNLGRYDGLRYGHTTAETCASLHEAMCKNRSEGFGDEVKRRILLGTYVLSAGYADAYYKKAQALRQKILAEYTAAFEKYDVLLAPTVPTAAFAAGAAPKDPVEIYRTDICTVPVNIAGLPGISLPCGVTAGGLPIGLQLIAAPFKEAKLLNAAHAFEQAAGLSLGTPFGVRL
ncbi:MAG: Asp-tRNA(Asn)/Glu-tRNA(Gln) amidotransferase subunit GatA [Clostridia bacterium]|nr:Asp-tRNA(Asn)/Glu-tRNA(Gln) amidotransferase subunit GatA [Clostridia bacterium]